MEKITIRGLVAVAAMLASICGGSAGAAELKVLSAVVMGPVLQELGPAFEKSSGNKLKIQYDSAGKIADKVAADADIDVAIMTKPLADKLIGKAKLVGGTSAVLARTPLGLAVKKGKPKPDISSVDALKKTLLGAKSIAYIDPASGGASGVQVAQVLEKLGIAAELKAKTRLVAAPAGKVVLVGDVVKRGQAEIGIQSITLLTQAQGIDIVGPLPAELQGAALTFVAASPMTSEKPLPAKAFIDFLASPAAKAVYKAKGMEPG